MNDRAPLISMLESGVRHPTEHTFETHDGVALFYRHWRAATQAARGAIVLLHRGHEHSGRMGHLPAELDLPDDGSRRLEGGFKRFEIGVNVADDQVTHQ